MKTGVEIIAEERQRQMDVEHWSLEHDLKYKKNELANAAATYAMDADCRDALTHFFAESTLSGIPPTWPWDEEWYKPTPDDRIRELAKAGALIAAEIDRINKMNEIKEKLENK